VAFLTILILQPLFHLVLCVRQLYAPAINIHCIGLQYICQVANNQQVARMAELVDAPDSKLELATLDVA